MKFTSPIQSLFLHIQSLAKENPSTPLFVQSDKEGKIGKQITREDFLKNIKSIAGWFLLQGLKAGDSISLGLSNSTELLAISWAAWSLGIITVPLDVKRDTLAEHKYKINLTKVKLLIYQEGLFSEEELNSLNFLKKIIVSQVPFNKKILKDIPWKRDLSHQALILFTSGTTSHPKGVQLSLENLVANADGIKDWFKINENERFLVILPLHHINSTSFCLATLLAGASIAVLPTYSNSKFWQQVVGTQASFTSIVQSICFDQLSREKEFNDVRDRVKLTRIQIGSAPVVVSDAKEFIELFKIPLYQGYGQTETALRVTGVPLDINKNLYEKLVDENSIGIPMKWVEVEIMDRNGKILGENKEGELVVKGPVVMKGYLGLDEGFRNGYFLTGDIGYFRLIDGKRYFFLKGRKKEIIIKGGINISPVAVEDRIKQLSDAIDQVFVIGVPDKRFGEEMAAVICWKKEVDAEKEKLGLKQKLLQGTEIISTYESPKYIASIAPEEIPMTSTGKVQRSVLREKLDSATFEPISLIIKDKDHRFMVLSTQSPYLDQAFKLYNYSWDPLTVDKNTFENFVKNMICIVALNKSDIVRGLIFLERISKREAKLKNLKYADLLNFSQDSIIDKKGESIICVAICGSNYKKETIPDVSKIPSASEIEKYLKAGKDSVFNFHQKAKGGLGKGAELLAVLPNSRPEDKRALGFNMLMKYPPITQNVVINDKASVATQLIEVVMFLAYQLDIKNVYAFSRPSGLARYISRKN